MNKKSLLLFFAVIAVLSSCTPNLISSNELEENTQKVFEEISHNPYLIQKENALRSLVQIARQLDDQNLLRAGEPSFLDRLSSITEADLEVVDNSSTLRAASTGRTEEMFYLVNFDRDAGGGYAVLSADERIPDPVLCIIEEGSISVEDFEPQTQVYSEDTIRNYVPEFRLYDSVADDYYIAMTDNNDRRHNTHLMINYYERVIDYDDHYGGGGSGGGTPTPVTTEYGEWVVKEGINALLNTKWHQSSPFNDKAPEKRKYWLFGSKSKAPAGCVPIAIAQIVTHNKFPSNMTVNGVKMDWNSMNSAYSYLSYSATPEVQNMISTFTRSIGVSCDSKYTYHWTFTFPKKPVKYLESLGYKNVKYRLGKYTNTCIDMISEGKPVFISAISGLFGGHGWVLDGFRVYEREVIKKQGSTIVNSWKETRTLVHSNFGWGGLADGYYAAGTFNLKNGAEETDEKDRGETGINKSHFGWGFSVITYDLN